MPRNTMVSVNARLTDETSVSNSSERGFRNTLQAYTAPRATWTATPAAATTHRLPTFAAMTPLLRSRQFLGAYRWIARGKRRKLAGARGRTIQTSAAVFSQVTTREIPSATARAPVHRGKRPSEGPGGRGRMEHPRSGARGSRLHRGLAMAQPGRVPVRPRGDRAVPESQVGARARVRASQGPLVV